MKEAISKGLRGGFLHVTGGTAERSFVRGQLDEKLKGFACGATKTDDLAECTTKKKTANAVF